MENFLAIVLMIMPGFIVRKIEEETKTRKEIKSEAEKTIISLIYSFPVLILNLFVLIYIVKLNDIDEIINSFKDLEFVLGYAILTIFTIFITTLAIIFIETKLKMKLINFFRKERGEPEKTNSISPWEDFFKEGTNEMPVKILKNDKIIAQGFVKHWDLDGKSERDIVLVNVQDMINNEVCFTKIKREYVDYKNDLVIQEFYFDETKLQNKS